MELAAPVYEFLIQPLNEFLDTLRNFVPGFLWFVIITIAGYFVASILGWAVKKLLYRINIDKRLRKLDLHDSIGEVSVAKLAGIILKWYVFIVFLSKAITLINLGGLSYFIEKIVNWIPSLILGISIIIIGLILIDFIIHKLLELKNKYIRIVSNLIKGILVIVVIFTAIEQLGIKTDLAQSIFLMVIAAALVTFSLAFGIGLGLSLKDELKPIVKKFVKKLK